MQYLKMTDRLCLHDVQMLIFVRDKSGHNPMLDFKSHVIKGRDGTFWEILITYFPLN